MASVGDQTPKREWLLHLFDFFPKRLIFPQYSGNLKISRHLNQKTSKMGKAMKSVKRIVLSKPVVICIGLLVFYTLAGFFLAPFLVRYYVPKFVGEKLQKRAAIGDVRINPFIYTFEVNDFRMDEPGGQPIVGFKRLFVDFELKSVFNRAWTFQEVALEGPLVKAVIDPDGSVNLAHLVPAGPPSQAPAKPGSSSRLIVQHFVIDQGQISITDGGQSQPATIEFKPMRLEVNNLTTLPDQEGSETFTAATTDGETMRWSGSISLNPVRSRGKLAFENFQNATLWKFARDALNLESPAGRLTATADYEVELSGSETQIAFSNVTLTLAGLALKLQGADAPLLELPDAQITGARVDVAKQDLEAGKVSVKGGHARLVVDQSGQLNVQRVVRSSVKPAASSGQAAPTASGKPWKVKLNNFDFSGFALDYDDTSRTPGLRAGIGSIKVGLKAEAEAGVGQPKVLVSNIAVDVSDFRAGFSDSSEQSAQIQRLALEGGAYDLAANTLTLGKVAVEGGALDVRRFTDGSINLALLFAPPQKGAVAKEAQEVAAEGRSFQFLSKTISITGLKTSFSDLSVRPDSPVISLEDLSALLNDVDGKSPMKFELSLKVREGGQIKAAGTVNPSTPSVESDIQVTNFGLTPFQPYLDRLVALTLKSGSVSTRGNLRYGTKEGGAKIAYQGAFRLDNVRLVEPGESETLLGWKALQADQMKLLLEPNRLETGEVKLAQLTTKFIIHEDRTLNLVKVIKTGSNAKSTPQPPPETVAGAADSFPVLVRRIVLTEGEVDFADLSLKPQFGTRIHNLRGVVAGISTVRGARAQVRLNGQVDEYGTAKIDGELNPSDPKAFTDISAVFRNVEMTRLTPYSARFAGRKIDSGKLSVDLKYLVRNAELTGANQIVVERLILGEKIPSPDAVDLPLDLAIALLEDSNGVIEIGLPVKGDLNSPEFSYGQLIWKAIGNLIGKIVTSPFRALAALLPGGGEETLNAVAFGRGRSEVPPPEKEKLAKLADALKKRPHLRLLVQGGYNPEIDLPAMRRASLRRALALRQGQKLEPGEDPGPVDYGGPETEKALEGIFTERFGADALKVVKADMKAAEDKSKKDAAAEGKTPTPESGDPGQLSKILFARLVDAEPVGDSDLAKLADARAKAIVSELTVAGQIPAERVQVNPSTAMEKGDAATAALTLEPMG
jgi:hypothetical protein